MNHFAKPEVSAKRIFLVGAFAFGWKKKNVYTIIA
jgi:hypothetical protein